MLYSCYIVSWTKADGTLKTWKTVPTRLVDTAKASRSLLAFRQLLSRDSGARK